VDGLVIGSDVLVPPPDGYYSEALDCDLKFTSVADDDDTWYVDDGGYGISGDTIHIFLLPLWR
jgi:hypothetical protein